MLTSVCLLWIGAQLNAPVWYYFVVGFKMTIEVLSFGYKVGKN